MAVSDEDVRNWFAAAPRTERDIYDAAKQHGVSAEQLERVKGWSAGTVSDWTAKNGVESLPAQPQPEKPQPSLFSVDSLGASQLVVDEANMARYGGGKPSAEVFAKASGLDLLSAKSLLGAQPHRDKYVNWAAVMGSDNPSLAYQRAINVIVGDEVAKTKANQGTVSRTSAYGVNTAGESNLHGQRFGGVRAETWGRGGLLQSGMAGYGNAAAVAGQANQLFQSAMRQIAQSKLSQQEKALAAQQARQQLFTFLNRLGG
ncbi:hypothetical protein [Aquaspirillum soli]